MSTRELLLGRGGRAALFLSAALYTAAPAVAANPVTISDFEETVVTEDGSEIAVWLGASYFNAPVANGLGTVGDNFDFLFLVQTDNGAALNNPGFSAGASIWAPMNGYTIYGALDGDRARAANQDSITASGDLWVDPLPVDGNLSFGAFSVSLGDVVVSSATIEYGRLTAATGVGVGGASGVDWAFGLLGSAAMLHMMSSVYSEANPADYIDLDERVKMLSVGPMIAATSEHDLGGEATMTLSGRAAALFAHGELAASLEDFTTGSSTATDSVSAFAGLIEAEARLGMAVSEGMELFVSGGVGARNDHFSINNPRSESGVDVNEAASYDPGPAHLVQGIMLRATASVGVAGTF